MIQAFIKLTEDLKIYGINPRLNFMDNEASADLKTTMSIMNIKYQLVTPSNHREKCRDSNSYL